MARRKPPEQEPDARDKLINAYVRCFNSPEGQVVLDDLKRTYQDKSSVGALLTTGLVDPNFVLVHEGARLVYLKIVGMIEEGEAHGRNTATDSASERSPDGLTGDPSVFDA